MKIEMKIVDVMIENDSEMGLLKSSEDELFGIVDGVMKRLRSVGFVDVRVLDCFGEVFEDVRDVSVDGVVEMIDVGEIEFEMEVE